MKKIIILLLILAPITVHAQSNDCADEIALEQKACAIEKSSLQDIINGCFAERSNLADQLAEVQVQTDLVALEQKDERRALQAKLKAQNANVDRLNKLRTTLNRTISSQRGLIQRLRSKCGAKCSKVK